MARVAASAMALLLLASCLAAAVASAQVLPPAPPKAFLNARWYPWGWNAQTQGVTSMFMQQGSMLYAASYIGVAAQDASNPGVTSWLTNLQFPVGISPGQNPTLRSALLNGTTIVVTRTWSLLMGGNARDITAVSTTTGAIMWTRSPSLVWQFAPVIVNTSTMLIAYNNGNGGSNPTDIYAYNLNTGANMTFAANISGTLSSNIMVFPAPLARFLVPIGGSTLHVFANNGGYGGNFTNFTAGSASSMLATATKAILYTASFGGINYFDVSALGNLMSGTATFNFSPLVMTLYMNGTAWNLVVPTASSGVVSVNAENLNSQATATYPSAFGSFSSASGNQMAGKIALFGSGATGLVVVTLSDLAFTVIGQSGSAFGTWTAAGSWSFTQANTVYMIATSGSYSAVAAVDMTSWNIVYVFYGSETSGVMAYGFGTIVCVTGATNSFVLADANARGATTTTALYNPQGSSWSVVNNGKLYWLNDSTTLVQFDLAANTFVTVNMNGTTFTGTSTMMSNVAFTTNYMFFVYQFGGGPVADYICSVPLATLTTSVPQCVRFDNFTNCVSTAATNFGFGSWIPNPNAGADTIFFMPQSTNCAFRYTAAGVLSAAGLSPSAFGFSSTSVATALVDGSGNLYLSGTGQLNNGFSQTAGWTGLYPSTTGFNLTDGQGATPSAFYGGSSTTTPVIFRGFFYISNSTGVMCLDLSLNPQWMTPWMTGSTATLSQLQDVLYASTTSAWYGIGPQQAGQTYASQFFMSQGSAQATNADGTVFGRTASPAGNITTNRYLGRFVNAFNGFRNIPCAPWSTGSNFAVFTCTTPGSGGGIVAVDDATGNFVQGGLYQGIGFTPIFIDGSSIWYWNRHAGYGNTLVKQTFVNNLVTLTAPPPVMPTRQPLVIPPPRVGLAFSQWIVQRANVVTPSSFINLVPATLASTQNVLLACMRNGTGTYAVSMDAESGGNNWAFYLSGMTPSSNIDCTPSVQGPLVLFTVKSTSNVFALDINTGRQVWMLSLSGIPFVSIPIPSCAFVFNSGSNKFTVSYVSMSLGNSAIDGIYPSRGTSPAEAVGNAGPWPATCATLVQYPARFVAADGYGNIWFDVPLNVINPNQTQVSFAQPTISPATNRAYAHYFNATNSWLIAVDNTTKQIAMSFNTLVDYAQPGQASVIQFNGGAVFVVINSWVIAFNETTGALLYTTNYNYNPLTAMNGVMIGATSTAIVGDYQNNLQNFDVLTGTWTATTKISGGNIITYLASDPTFAYVSYSSGASANVYRVTPAGLSFQSSLTLADGRGAAATPLGSGRGVAVVNGPQIQVAKFADGAVLANYNTSLIYPQSFQYQSGTYYTVTTNSYAQKVDGGNAASPFSWNVSLGLAFPLNDLLTAYLSNDGSIYTVYGNNTMCAIKTATGTAALAGGMCMNVADVFGQTCTFLPGDIPPAFLGESNGQIFFAVGLSQCVFKLASSGATSTVTAISVAYSESQTAAFDGSGIIVSDGIYVYKYAFGTFATFASSSYQLRSVALPGATSPIAASGSYFVGTVNGVVSLNSGLGVNWQYSTPSRIQKAPVPFSNFIIAIDVADYDIFAINQGSGTLAWMASFSSSIYNTGKISSVTASSSGVLVVALTNGVVVLDTNGKIVWSDYIGAIPRSFASTPCVPTGRIFPVPSSCTGVRLTPDTASFLASCSSNFLVRDVATGQILLSIPTTLTSEYALDTVAKTLAYPGSNNIFRQQFSIPAILPVAPATPTTGAPTLNFYATLSTAVFDQAAFVSAIATIAGVPTSSVIVNAWSRDNFGRILVQFSVASQAAANLLATTPQATLTAAGITMLGSAPVDSSPAPVLDNKTEDAIKAGAVALWIIVVLIVLGGVATLFLRMRAGGHGHAHGGGYEPATAAAHDHGHSHGHDSRSPELDRPLVAMKEVDSSKA